MMDTWDGIPDTTHVVPSALFQFDTAALPAKRAVTDIKKMTFDPTCDVIGDVPIFFKILGKFKPGAIKCRFRIENW